LRALEIYSVRTGGGSYNRSGLFDGILIKDNHLALTKKIGLSLPEVVAQCRIDMPHTIKIGLEIANLVELDDAIQAQPDYLVLDNMSLHEIIESVKYTNGRIPIDVTGSVNISNLESIAATGISMVGVGSITHSAPSLDMSLGIAPD
jgi:nicotinate-nucleotide pyrophosphorylase (carboxylating)